MRVLPRAKSMMQGSMVTFPMRATTFPAILDQSSTVTEASSSSCLESFPSLSAATFHKVCPLQQVTEQLVYTQLGSSYCTLRFMFRQKIKNNHNINDVGLSSTYLSPRFSSQCRPIFPWNLHNLDWVRVINIWTSTSAPGPHRSNLFSFDHFYQSSVLTHRPLLCASHEWTLNCALYTELQSFNWFRAALSVTTLTKYPPEVFCLKLYPQS